MDLPIELFLSFIAFAVVMGIIGLWKRIPIMMFIAGAVITFWAITTDNIDMGSIPVTNSTIIQEVLVSNTTEYHYIVESASATVTLAQSGTMNYARSEALSSSGGSALEGDILQCIDLRLARVGNAIPSTIISIGVFTNDNTMVQQYGQISPSSINTTMGWYTVCTNESQERTLARGDKVGFNYLFGNSTHHITTEINDSNPFDGTLTVRANIQTGFTNWVMTSGGDMTMRMYDFVQTYAVIEDFDTVVSEDNFEFTEYPKILFGVIASIFMLAGALIWKYEEN